MDFDGDGLKDVNATDPEIVTYRFDPGTGQLTFTANAPAGTPMKRPILAGNVTKFVLKFTSSRWLYDMPPRDGITDWTEIDALGDKDGIFDDGEFSKIDSVGVTMQLLDGVRKQTYTTQVDLRNQNQN